MTAFLLSISIPSFAAGPGGVVQISVMRHPLARPLSKSEATSILKGAQDIISRACDKAWQSECRFHITQLEVPPATWGDLWVRTEPQTIFTREDIDVIAKDDASRAGSSGKVLLRVVRSIHSCRSHPFTQGVNIMGCTQGNSIFVALGEDSKAVGSDGKLISVRDGQWVADQSLVWAHEIGHAAGGLQDLCADKFKRRLMFWLFERGNTKLTLQECKIFETYPKLSLDYDIDPTCSEVRQKFPRSLGN
jgi:hypothetical protein